MSKVLRVVAKHPETLRDASGRLVGAEPFDADMAVAFWRRLYRWGDIVQAPATAATKASASAATTGGKA